MSSVLIDSLWKAVYRIVMAIDPTSYLSYEEIKNDLIAYVKGRPDANSWVDFFESSAGLTNIELQAHLASMFNIRIDHSRRESYITEAKLKSSVYLIALALGYNPHRKHCPRFTAHINIQGNASQVSIIKGDNVLSGGTQFAVTNSNVIIRKALPINGNTALSFVKAVSGISNAYISTPSDIFTPLYYVPGMKFSINGSTTSANDSTYTILSIESTKLTLVDTEDFDTGEAFTANTNLIEAGNYPLDVIVGEWKTHTQIIKNPFENYQYTLGLSNYELSSDIEIDIDGHERLKYVTVVVNGTTELKTVNRIENFDAPEEVMVLSTHLGDVKMSFGDGILGFAVSSGDSIVTTYIESPGLLNGVSTIQWAPINTAIASVASMLPTDIVSLGTAEEATEKVKTLAPIYYSSLGRGVTKVDIEVIANRYPYFQDTALREGLDAFGNPISVTLQLAYVMNPEEDIQGDSQILSQTLKDEFQAYFNLFRMAGTFLQVYDPLVKTVDFRFHVVFADGFDTIDLTSAIRAVIETRLLKLNTPLFISPIEKDIADIAGITRVYVEYPYRDGILGFNEYFKIGELQVEYYSDEQTLLAYYTPVTPDGYGN